MGCFCVERVGQQQTWRQCLGFEPWLCPFPAVWPSVNHSPFWPQLPQAERKDWSSLRALLAEMTCASEIPKLPAVPMLSNDLCDSPCHSWCSLHIVPASWVCAFLGSGQLSLCVSVQSGWIRDLPKLTSLYLRKMPRLQSLEGDIFKTTPDLQHLDCQDSPALTSVQTHIFQDTPHLQLLLLQK